MMRILLFYCFNFLSVLEFARGAGLIPGKAFERFITIWLENQDFDQVVVDPAFADLARRGQLLTRYYGLTRPSQPNYLAAVGGDYFGLDHDGPVRVPANVSTVVDLLDAGGISWAGYFEDMPGPGYMAVGSDGQTGGGKWDYVRKHNPFVSYDSINTNGTRLLNLQSLADFSRALAAGTLPQYVFLTPNMMHDGHNTSLAYATAWAHEFLSALLADDDDGSSLSDGGGGGGGTARVRTLIALTYDESATYAKPNQIATLLLGSAVPPALRGTADAATFYTHYSLLASVQANWGLPHLGRYDAGANAFSLVASASAAASREPANAAAVDNSVSYPGLLSADPARRVPVPPPNARLRAVAAGTPVLESVRAAWRDDLGDTPYDGSGDVRDGGLNLPVYGPAAENAA